MSVARRPWATRTEAALAKMDGADSRGRCRDAGRAPRPTPDISPEGRDACAGKARVPDTVPTAAAGRGMVTATTGWDAAGPDTAPTEAAAMAMPDDVAIAADVTGQPAATTDGIGGLDRA